MGGKIKVYSFPFVTYLPCSTINSLRAITFVYTKPPKSRLVVVSDKVIDLFIFKISKLKVNITTLVCD